MKKINLFFIVFYLAVLLLPIVASAAQVSLPYFGGKDAPFVSCNGANCTTCDLFETGQRVIYFGMTLVLFVFGPIMVTIGGLMMLIAGGSEDRFSTGKKMATGAVVGILIALGAFLIVNLGIDAINATGAIPGMTRSGLTISCTATSPYVPKECATDVNGVTTCWTVPPPATPQSNQTCATDVNGEVTCYPN